MATLNRKAPLAQADERKQPSASPSHQSGGPRPAYGKLQTLAPPLLRLATQILVIEFFERQYSVC